jgi:hypothetical protein
LLSLEDDALSTWQRACDFRAKSLLRIVQSRLVLTLSTAQIDDTHIQLSEGIREHNRCPVEMFYRHETQIGM